MSYISGWSPLGNGQRGKFSTNPGNWRFNIRGKLRAQGKKPWTDARSGENCELLSLKKDPWPCRGDFLLGGREYGGGKTTHVLSGVFGGSLNHPHQRESFFVFKGLASVAGREKSDRALVKREWEGDGGGGLGLGSQ